MFTTKKSTIPIHRRLTTTTMFTMPPLAPLPNVYYTAAQYTYASAPQHYHNVYYPTYYDPNHIVREHDE
jgi:hypothetical protein